MDVNHYTRVGIVSPVAGFTQPEILQEAKQGLIDDSFPVDYQRVFDLLGGQTPAAHPQREAYRLLLVGACNAYHKMMPFLFEPIADYTELLMPGDLLSENSILQAIRDALTEDTCQDVEVIGWLYEGYISERKDEVIGGKAKIQPEDIPAATQLFTPHWIVRYLVENSLGRLWLLNRPNSRMAECMEYYIQPEETETDFLRISSPEEIKVCDPACGSGHMLTYAFDLLYQIYEEEGYDPVQIPRLILEKNLYGIEIDHRAGDLAAFALTMKAREKDHRFFRRKVMPNICVLENVHFTGTELDDYMEVVGRDLFTQDLEITLNQFEQTDNFGSLIRPLVTNIDDIRQRLVKKGLFENLFLHATNQKVQQILDQTEYLSPRYHVVVANPPYMGGKGMNTDLKYFAKEQYPDSKSDTFAMFIERGFELVKSSGYIAMVTMESWMFLSSYEKLRSKIVNNSTLLSMVHMPYLGKGGTSTV
jgi:type II restriction/modification system DNA methylase subunit YeeA